jgi:hypothetical protein
MVAQQVKFTGFYGTEIFIIVLTRTRHRSLFWARWIQSTLPNPVTLRSILILSSYLCVGLPCPLPFRFSNQNCFHISHHPHAHYLPHPPQPPWFDHPNNIWWLVQSSSLYSFLQPPVTSSLLSPIILLITVIKHLNRCYLIFKLHWLILKLPHLSESNTLPNTFFHKYVRNKLTAHYTCA